MTALILLFLTALAVLFVGLSHRRNLLQPIALVGVLSAFVVSCISLTSGDFFGLNQLYPEMLLFDRYAEAFTATVLLSTALIIGLSSFGFRSLHDTLGDNYALLLFTVCGAICMFSFQNITMLFLGIEILSIPLYVLAGSRRDNTHSNEAALKYFLMGAFATGILLFGTALVYGATASFDLKTIAANLADGRPATNMLHIGILLMLVGLSFKISAVPFHFWAPDVYTGSPNTVTVFMATVVKTAGFAAFFKLFNGAFGPAAGFWEVPVAAVAAVTMTLANLTALFQNDFKRMMAYSSISHAGYLLLGVLAGGNMGAGAILLYTFAYSLATICAFGAYMAVSEPRLDGSFGVFNGLEKKSPLLAAIMAISMLSLAGIPPTAGFFGKYFVFSAVFNKYPWLVVLAVINSAISIYYYFKVIIAMYFTRDSDETAGESIAVPAGIRWVVLAGMLLIAFLTVLPGHVYALIF